MQHDSQQQAERSAAQEASSNQWDISRTVISLPLHSSTHQEVAPQEAQQQSTGNSLDVTEGQTAGGDMEQVRPLFSN